MPVIQLELVRPHAGQAQVLAEARRFNVVCCGRRWGKTVLGQDRVVQPALAGKPTGWFSPTYRSLSDAWRQLGRTLQPVIETKNEAEHRLELKGGGSIEAWSLDSPDAGRGRAYAVVVVDEAAIVPDLKSAWEENVRPMLTDHKGTAWFLSTPKGTANYFHTLYQRGHGLLRRQWRSWSMPTAANPFIDPAEIAAAREDLSDLAFAQEYLAQFVSWQGAVFRKILDAVAASPTQGRAAVIGVDWGRVNDYTVFCVLSDAAEVLELDRFRGIEYSLQRARLGALYERHGRPTIIAEANNMGGPVIEQLARDGLKVRPFVTTNASKAAAVEALALAFERGEIRIPNDPALIGELQGFEAKPLPSGLMRYEAASGGHDDIVMALAIAHAGLGDAARRRDRFKNFAEIMGANADLACGNPDGSLMDVLPHEHPLGGGSDRNAILRQRWRN